MEESPAYSFIKERISLEFKRLEREKVTPWSFLTTDFGLHQTDFFGKQINYKGVGFEGSPREVFWNSFIQPFLMDIVSRSFSETVKFCSERGIDGKIPLEETAIILKQGINKIYERMVDIDRRLRGKGYPNSVSPYNPQAHVSSSEAFVEERLRAETALMSKKKNKLNAFYEEQKFWIWAIGVIIAVAGIIIKFFG
jgi:hypothetical protein